MTPTQPIRRNNVAIIGGGPAGLMAAEKLAASGAKITIYDHMPSVGRKFLMAGRGGLNLTHSEPLDSFIARYGKAAAWIKPAIDAFPPDALRAWCEGLGQETFVGSSGRVFPRAMKASPLLREWLRRLDELGVEFALRHRWQGWDDDGALIFTTEDGTKKSVQADATVLALGGGSWHRLGSDGGWVSILQNVGINIAPLRPANCGFTTNWSDIFIERFAGNPVKPVIISFQDKTLQGEMIVTRNGIEGGAIYALSQFLRDAIENEGEATLSLDLRPSLSVAELATRLQAPRGSQSATTYLRKAAGLSPVALGLMRESLSGTTLPTDTAALVDLIKHTKIKLTAPAPIMRAISSSGGITADEIDTTFMLKKKSGVFAIGEMLDWEAPTGGYLLQASFSMGVAVAKGIKIILKK